MKKTKLEKKICKNVFKKIEEKEKKMNQNRNFFQQNITNFPKTDRKEEEK